MKTSTKYAVSAAILILVVAVIIILIINKDKQERFDNRGKPADLPDGLYRVVNKDGLPLTSNIIDTVQCKNFLIGEVKPVPSLDWKLKRVAQSVYIFYKLGEKECLFTHPSNDLRSFFFPSCDTQNLCGLEQPDARGELDPDSLRTYFMLLQSPEGKYFIKSLKNDMFVCMTNSKLSFKKKPDESCMFDFTKQADPVMTVKN